MKHVNDYAKLKTLKDVVGSFIVMGVDMPTREVRCYAAHVVYSDHKPVVQVRTATQSIMCLPEHRFLTTILTRPFAQVPESCLRWVRALDLQQGMTIAVAPTAPMQPVGICQDRYLMGHNVIWAPVTAISATSLFEHYGVEVFENDNYIMNDMLQMSYGK